MMNDEQPVAGPSRPSPRPSSPRRSPPIPPNQGVNDVEMVTMEEDSRIESESQLINPSSSSVWSLREEVDPDKKTVISSYATHDEDLDVNSITETSVTLVKELIPPPTLDDILETRRPPSPTITPNAPIASTSNSIYSEGTEALVSKLPARSPTPPPPQPQPSTSPHSSGPQPKSSSKSKRKRTTPHPSSSRRASIDPSLPPHFMGEENEIIRCICGVTEDDGLTIQCEGCFAWQHAICFGYPDAESAPDIYYCELCQPRPYDAIQARKSQLEVQARRELDRNEEGDVLHHRPVGLSNGIMEKGGKSKQGGGGGGGGGGGKGKRQRMGSVIDTNVDSILRDEKDGSPGRSNIGVPLNLGGGAGAGGNMAPPQAKPRRKPGPKPKSRNSTSNTTSQPKESTPAPPNFPESISSTSVQQKDSLVTEENDDYFKFEPWTMEYTPITNNIVRSSKARRIMVKMYKEWVDAEHRGGHGGRGGSSSTTSSSPKGMRSIGPSGLPSPTDTGADGRLSPDDLFPSTDFSILAPPVPPVLITSDDLSSISQKITVKAISTSQSFLPLTFVGDTTSLSSNIGGAYTKPAMYGIFSNSNHMETGTFIGEYKGEITDCETYRNDPINQYTQIGMTKPFVRSIGPPINLVIDSRGYGNDLRFIRSGCHPNVVIRPILLRPKEKEMNQSSEDNRSTTPTIAKEGVRIKFGIFASKDINKKEELILGWEWDDEHIIHTLRGFIHPTINSIDYNNCSPSKPLYSSLLPHSTVSTILDKFESVLTSSMGNFSNCACLIKRSGNCTISQMKWIVINRISGKNGLKDNKDVGGGRKGEVKRADLGCLVGAVRGWRRDEMELKEVRKWNLPEMKEMLERGWKEDVSVEEGEEREGRDRSRSIDSVMRRSEDIEVDEEDEDEERQGGESNNDDDVEMEDSILVGESEDRKEVVQDVRGDEEVIQNEDEEEEEEEEAEDNEYRPERGLRRGRDDILTSFLSVKKTTPESPTNPGGPLSNGITPHRPIPSSSLSSPPIPTPARSAETDEDGHLSDATTATIPRSTFSSDNETDQESDSEIRKSRKSGAGAGGGGVQIGKKRRVLSPVIESTSRIKGNSNHVRKTSDGNKGRRKVSDDVKVKVVDSKVSNKRQRNRILSSPHSEDIPNLPDLGDTKQEEDEGEAALPQAQENMEIESEVDPVKIEESMEPVVEAVKEPTPPPPEPPKKISLSEYLRTHRIRKESTIPSPIVDNLPENANMAFNIDLTPTGSNDIIPIVDTPSEMPAVVEIKPDPSPVPSVTPLPPTITPGNTGPRSSLNMFDFLPNGNVATPQQESPRPSNLTTPSASFVPRNEYFPLTVSPSTTSVPTPSASFQPRASSTSSSYAPRASTESLVDPSPLQSSTYVPRQQSIISHEEEMKSNIPPSVSASSLYDEMLPLPNGSGPQSGVAVGADWQSRQTASVSPVRSSISLPTMPPPFQQRDLPPHVSTASLSPETRINQLPSISPTDKTSPHSRVPPTGPKQVLPPPTGPRWSNGSTGSSNGPISTVGGVAAGGGAGERGVGGAMGRGPPGPVPVPGLGGRGGYGGRGGGMFDSPRGVWRGRGYGPPRGRGRGG